MLFDWEFRERLDFNSLHAAVKLKTKDEMVAKVTQWMHNMETEKRIFEYVK